MNSEPEQLMSLSVSCQIRKILRTKGSVDQAVALVNRLSFDRWMTRKWNTLAHEAARFNVPRMIRALYEVSYPVDSANSAGLSPLHWAVFYGSLETVEELLKCKHDIDAADVKGMTALHLAILQRNTTVVRFLLDRGADPLKRINGVMDCFALLESMEIEHEFDYLEIKELMEEYQKDSFFSQVLVLL